MRRFGGTQKENDMPTPRHKIALSLALLSAAAAALAASSTAGSGSAELRGARLQTALDEVVAAGAPGAVLLVRDGRRTIRLTSGYGNLKPKTPMRTNDRFRVGS